MDCLPARQAMSAQMDGEPPGVSEALVEAHVRLCEDCQSWREAAFEVTRRVRMTGWVPQADLTETILTAAQSRRRRDRGRPARAVLLVAAAIGQLVLTVPLLADAAGAGARMDMHGSHELGVFDFALAVAFLVGAIRPRLASGLAWPCCAAAFGLVATSMVDIISHRTFEAHEVRHLIAVAGALLLVWAARDARRPEPQGVLAEPVDLRPAYRHGAVRWHVVGHQEPGHLAADRDPPAASAIAGGAA